MEIAALPRPAFTADLERLAKAYPELRALVIVDGGSEAARASLDRWLGALSPRQIVIAGLRVVTDKVSRAAPGIRVVELPDSGDAGAVAILATLAPAPHFVVTCEPYDAYGAFVKSTLETRLLPLIKRWNACFLAHDATYGTLRCYNYALLRDRLLRRRHRLAWYRYIVGAFYRVVELVGSERSLGWRRLKGS